MDLIRLMRIVWVAIGCLSGATVAAAQTSSDLGIEARLSAPLTTIPPGEPVIVEFSIRNLTDSPIVLSVPGMEPEPARSMAGLDLAHLFSGPGFRGLTIESTFNRVWRDAQGYDPPRSAPKLVIAPHGIVGTSVAVDAFYPHIRTAGMYRLVWEPFGGLARSNVLTINVSAFKQAIIVTDLGSMTVAFDYLRAPNHVANFIELARSGFYNQKTFHRLEPGFYLQGGCPKGDGTGIRLDGKKLDAEFNDRPFERGTVCMARLESDPNSASCQFIICNTRLPQWDGRYTAFGKLVGKESYETLDKLMRLEVDETGRPIRAIHLRSVRITDAPDGFLIDSVDQMRYGARSMTTAPQTTTTPSGQQPPRRPLEARPTQRSQPTPTDMEPMQPVYPRSQSGAGSRQHDNIHIIRPNSPQRPSPSQPMQEMEPTRS